METSLPPGVPLHSVAVREGESFGLSEAPFAGGADPRFFYHSAAHDRVAQELLSAIRRRDGIVVVTGEPGAGKTMLCRAVVEQLDRRTLTSFVADSQPDTEELLKAVLADFGVTDAGNGTDRATRRELNAALRQFLASLAPLQAFAVIVIDSAHRLPIDALQHLRMLSDIVSRDRLLQVVLVGPPHLSNVIARPELQQLAQRVSVRCVLQAMGEEEIGDYLAHRLAVAGWNGSALFDPAAQRRLYEFSAGNPQVINRIADRALALASAAAAPGVDRVLVDRAASDLEITLPAPRFSNPVTDPIGTSASNGTGPPPRRSRLRGRFFGWLS